MGERGGVRWVGYGGVGWGEEAATGSMLTRIRHGIDATLDKCAELQL